MRDFRSTIASMRRASPAKSSPMSALLRNREMYHLECSGSDNPGHMLVADVKLLSFYENALTLNINRGAQRKTKFFDEFGDFIVAHPDATARDIGADSIGIIGAVQAEVTRPAVERLQNIGVSRQSIRVNAVDAIRIRWLEELLDVIDAPGGGAFIAADANVGFKYDLVIFKQLHVVVAHRDFNSVLRGLHLDIGRVNPPHGAVGPNRQVDLVPVTNFFFDQKHHRCIAEIGRASCRDRVEW